MVLSAKPDTLATLKIITITGDFFFTLTSYTPLEGPSAISTVTDSCFIKLISNFILINKSKSIGGTLTVGASELGAACNFLGYSWEKINIMKVIVIMLVECTSTCVSGMLSSSSLLVLAPV